jgi:hypothetical protein
MLDVSLVKCIHQLSELFGLNGPPFRERPFGPRSARTLSTRTCTASSFSNLQSSSCLTDIHHPLAWIRKRPAKFVRGCETRYIFKVRFILRILGMQSENNINRRKEKPHPTCMHNQTNHMLLGRRKRPVGPRSVNQDLYGFCILKLLAKLEMAYKDTLSAWIRKRPAKFVRECDTRYIFKVRLYYGYLECRVKIK